MIKKGIEGDILEVGYSEDFQYILVFGHLGLNILNTTWMEFKNRYDPFKNIHDPFKELSSPTKMINDRWIQFILAKHENHGLNDDELENVFITAFQWAIEQKICRIITNGVRSIHDFKDGDMNRASINNRIKFIREICSREKYNHLEISLISMNDSYLRIE